MKTPPPALDPAPHLDGKVRGPMKSSSGCRYTSNTCLEQGKCGYVISIISTHKDFSE